MPFPTNLNRIQSSTSGLAGSADVGDALLTQTVTVTTTADGGSVAASLTLPDDSQIVDIIIDTIVNEAVGGGTATAIIADVGITENGTEYASGVDVFAGGRFRPTFTTAQLAAMDDIGTDNSVVITLSPNGTIVTTQGVYRMTVLYRQSV